MIGTHREISGKYDNNLYNIFTNILSGNLNHGRNFSRRIRWGFYEKSGVQDALYSITEPANFKSINRS